MYKTLAETPRFPASCGSTTVEIRDLAHVLDRWAGEYGLCLEPDFQRGHVWTREQAIAYVEFFISGGESGRTMFFNHPGWMGSFEGEFVLVDGLQRLTALRNFIDDNLPVFGKRLSEYEGGLRGVGNLITLSISKLQTRDEVLRWYLALNSGGTPHSEAELRRVRGLLAD